MSTNKDLLLDYVLVPWFRLIGSLLIDRQQADWKGPMDGSTLGEQRVSSKDRKITGGKLNAKENSSF